MHRVTALQFHTEPQFCQRRTLQIDAELRTNIRETVARALQEDIGTGDRTAELIPLSAEIIASMNQDRLFYLLFVCLMCNVDQIAWSMHYPHMTALTLKHVAITLPAVKKPEAKRLRM